jgi:hypothetical protein
MKTCTLCGIQKPLNDFWKDRSKKHGYSARCKPCRTAIYNKYRKEHGYDKKRYEKNPQAERERHLIRKYGINQARYDQMFSAQSGCCAICKKSQDRNFDVDHNHTTGEVRGLLCTNCNRMIGHANDDPKRLIAAAIYLGIIPQVAAEFIGAYIDSL